MTPKSEVELEHTNKLKCSLYKLSQCLNLFIFIASEQESTLANPRRLKFELSPYRYPLIQDRLIRHFFVIFF